MAVYELSELVAESLRIFAISDAGVEPATHAPRWRHSAIVPATCGLAMLVPEIVL